MAARRKAAKKAARKRVPARGAKKRATKPARRAAKTRAAKPARRAAKKRAAKPVRKAAKQRAAKPVRKPVKKRAARPVRRAAPARRAAPPAGPAAFAPQKSGASAKDLLLFEIHRGRVSVMAAIQGIGAGTTMRPVAEGKWTPHEIVLHLALRDRARLDEFRSLLAGNTASWAVMDRAALAEMNESQLAPLRGLAWDEAVRLLATTRAELMAALQAVPAEPAEVWSPSHPFGYMMHRLPQHDRDHAETIKNARIAG